MTKMMSCHLALLLSCVTLACAVEGQPEKSQDNKMEHYGPRMKETSDPAKINASQDALAKNIRMARKDARQGDIFTLEIRQLFRRLMYPELKGPSTSA